MVWEVGVGRDTARSEQDRALGVRQSSSHSHMVPTTHTLHTRVPSAPGRKIWEDGDSLEKGPPTP